jgi:competence protein ComEC
VGMVWWLAARFGLLKRARAALCIFVILIFLLVVPARPPTLRAALIFFIFCLAAFFRRYPNPINSLSVAAVILLLIRPTSLFEAGFQLSFAAVLGILFFVDGIDTFIHTYFFEPIESKIRKVHLSRLWAYSLSIFSVGLAAWLGGAGILLYHFQSITPLAPLWTVIAFPFIACILAFGFFKMIIAFLLPTVAALLTLILSFLSQILIAIVKLLSGISFSRILIGHIPLEVVLLYYSVIAVVAWSWFLRPRLRIIVSACAVLIFAVTIAGYKWQRTYPDELQVACLDVGHGQAIVTHGPSGTFLFDAGSQYNRNIGRYVVNTFLRYNGISQIDAIVISHDDIDHFNGVVEIVKNCKVKNIYAPPAFIGKTKNNGPAKYLRELLAEEGLDLKPLPVAIKSPAVKILWPDETAVEYESLSDNDKSAVALIEFAGRKILLCADIEHFAQQKLLERFEDLHADIVVVPHHGSLSTSDPRFLKRLSARYLIVSCGVGDLHRVQNNEIEIEGQWFYTGRDGAVIVNINKNGEIRIDSFR